MADEAAQDIEALNLRDKDRDDSERRDEVRGRDARFAQALFFQPAFAVFRDWHAYALPGPRKRRVRLFFVFFRRRVEPFDGDARMVARFCFIHRDRSEDRTTYMTRDTDTP